jgi:integrase
MQGKAENTLKRQAYDLALFAAYLEEAGVQLDCADFQNKPDCWVGITWGIIEGFAAWMLAQGYAVSSVNVRLSTVRTYARLATKAGVIDTREGGLIQTVSGYSRREARNADEKRKVTRLGSRKPATVALSDEQAAELKELHDDTPSGRRNQLMMALLLDHGLRASEAVGLEKAQFDLEEGTLRFYRPKTDEWTMHRMTKDTFQAAQAYLPYMPESGPIMRGSRRGGVLTNATLTRITLSRTVTRLGKTLGIESLSAHDCRHFAATDMARRGYDIKRLMDWFGWTSPATAVRYIESAEIQERDRG